jgi:hypothetical protein
MYPGCRIADRELVVDVCWPEVAFFLPLWHNKIDLLNQSSEAGKGKYARLTYSKRTDHDLLPV